MLYTYSIIPPLEDHFEERVADIIDQYKRNISSCPLIEAYIEPEGTPAWSLAKEYARIYARYKKELDAAGVPSGVLLQSVLGHGTSELAPAPFTYMEPLDGSKITAFCPMDESLLDHLCEEIKLIAAEHPSVIMLDDDIRLLMRPGICCGCPAHMREFNRRCGTNHTKESLYAHLMTCGERDPLAQAFVTLQRDTLVHAVARFREAVDSIDPTIQGVNCTSGDECDSVIYTNPIWCGKGNPTIVRTPNGQYAPETIKELSDTMRRAAVCGARLRDNGIQITLAESDTIPFNRYGKNARYLHTHYTLSILEGLKGAKHWITRTASYEPASGVAFRNVLAKHAGFYERLAELSDGLTYVGANSVFMEQKWYDFGAENRWRYHSNYWATRAFERMGLPFYFSNKRYGAAFLEDSIGKDLSDEAIREMFEQGSVFMSAEVARDLNERGYGYLTGVSVDGPLKERKSFEAYDAEASLTSRTQKNPMIITPTSESASVISFNGRHDDEVLVNVSPAVIKYDRAPGKFTVVYCGTPKARHIYTEGFAFLNETRKKQFISLLREAGQLPIYLPSDNELCLRAGYLADGRMLAAIYNFSYDPEEGVEVYLERTPTRIVMIDTDGEDRELTFRETADGTYIVDTVCEPAYPLVLIIQF